LLKNEVAVLKNADAEILGIGDEGQGEWSRSGERCS
jgi:hypothetical protein